MNNKYLIGIIVLVLVLIGGYYFLRSGYSQTPSSSAVPSQSALEPSPTPGSSPAVEAVKTITISGNEFNFTPAVISAKQGETVEITFKNAGQFPHNLAFPDLDVTTKTIQPGEEDTIKFTADKTGQFAFICSVDSHADRGMTGTLTVQ